MSILLSNKKIVIGSLNPVKIEATKLAFEKIFLDLNINLDITSYDIPSNVSNQPYGDNETLLGAKNRAIGAYNKYIEINNNKPDYSIGLEGGVTNNNENNYFECYAWVAIYNGEKFGIAKSASFILPKCISDLMLTGMELGDADDTIFRTINSKQGQGTIGQLTRGRITRTEYYEPVVILAYVPFSWPELYDN